MKLTKKNIPILLLVFFVASVFVLKGCGSELTGNGSGACPDSVAPSNATISAPTGLGVPSAATGTCYFLAFTVKDSTGKPMNGICVQVFSSASIAVQPPKELTCATATASGSSSILTRSDDNGNVMIEMVTPVTAVGNTFFVEAVSGGVTGGPVTTPGAK